LPITDGPQFSGHWSWNSDTPTNVSHNKLFKSKNTTTI